MTEPSHGEILRAIGVLEGQLKQLLDAAVTHNQERSSIGERVGRLEQRMGQVVILAMVAAMVAPMIWGEAKILWRDRQQLEHRQ